MALLLVTGALAVVTWNLASTYMLHQRELSASRQAEVNVRLVDRELASGSQGLDELLTGPPRARTPACSSRGTEIWVSSGRPVDPAALPEPLLALARDGVTARQRMVVDGVPVLAVALPLTAEEAVFVELFPLLELDRTLRFLAAVLIAGTATSTLMAVGLAMWTSGRALRPLTELTAAAQRVAHGNLTARLRADDDPDLAPLAATFNATAAALEQRVRRDARFAGDVSHELRSPLTTMANATAVLQRRRGELSATARRAVDLLAVEVDRFQRMVVDLLEISRDDLRADEGAWETVDLADLVSNVLAIRLAGGPALESEPGPHPVRGDRRRLDRVVANLLDNADRYGAGPVRVAVCRCDGLVRLEVDDAGPGVPDELKEQVFERFARGARAGRRGDDSGSGLGLALVAQHVARHGGAVRVEDRPGGGARFVVEIPAADDGAASGLA